MITGCIFFYLQGRDRLQYAAYVQTKPNQNVSNVFKSDLGFEITIPKNFKMAAKNTDGNFDTQSYIPLCQDAEVCIIPTTNLYPKTNYQGSSVSITVDKTLTTKNGCLKSAMNEGGMNITLVKNINGIGFNVSSIGNGAAGSQTTGTAYTTFYNNQCYKIFSQIGFSTYENYEPGTIGKFTDLNKADTMSLLDSIVSTFRFL